VPTAKWWSMTRSVAITARRLGNTDLQNPAEFHGANTGRNEARQKDSFQPFPTCFARPNSIALCLEQKRSKRFCKPSGSSLRPITYLRRNPTDAVEIMQVIPKCAAASPIDIPNVSTADPNPSCRHQDVARHRRHLL
jgi:hypothetical protein